MFTNKIFKNTLYIGLSLILLSALSACHNEDEAANLQVINLSPDAPSIRVNDDNLEFVNSLSYSGVTSLVDLMAGSHDVVFRGIHPDGTTPTVISRLGENFAEQTNTIVIAMNTYDSIDYYVIVQTRSAISSDTTRLRIAHLAPGTANIDVYVTAVDADLANSSALGTLGFKTEIYEDSLAAGEYQIRITPTNSQTVIFDSGSRTFNGGVDTTILLGDSTANGTSPLELLSVTGAIGTLIRDQNTPSDVRVVHASPTVGNLDIAIVESADAVADEITTPLFTNFAYTNSTVYQEFVPGTYNIKAVATATTTPLLLDTDPDPTFVFASNHSFYLIDTEMTDTDDVPTIETLQITRDQRRIVTDAKLDIVNTALNAGIVDVYLTAPGTDLSTIDPLGSLALAGSSNFISLEPDTYELTITENGDATNVLVPATSVTLVGGGIYTAVIIDDLITPANLLLLDDF